MSVAFLPRLANLLALRSGDPEARARFETRLRALGAWQLFRPAPMWVVGVREVPGSAPADERDERAGCYFAEGQSVLASSTDEARQRDRARLLSRCDRAPSSSEDADDLTFLYVELNGRAVLERSLGGRVPCYFMRRGEDLVLATDSGDLIRAGVHDGRPDPLITALCLSGMRINTLDGRAHLLGVRALNKAQGLVVETNGSVRVYEHWQPPAFDAVRWPTPKARQERVERFRAALLRVLDEQLTSSGTNLLSFSGGVDSSLLLALSVGKLGRPVATLSLIPEADDPAYARETTRIARMRELFPSHPHLSVEAFTEANWQLRRQLAPAAIPMFNPHMVGLNLLEGAAKPRVSFGGELADDVCGSHDFTRTDWVWHVGTRGAAVLPQDLPKAFKRVDLLRRLDELKERAARAAHAGVGHLEPRLHRDLHEEWRAARPRIECLFNENLGQIANLQLWSTHRDMDWQAMHWEWCGAQGVHRFAPFGASRVLALALSSHPSERLGRHDKRLSRRAFAAEAWAGEVLTRRDKGQHEKSAQTADVTGQWKSCVVALDAAWAAMIDPSWSKARAQLNELPDPGNLLSRKDLPLRLAFFSGNVYKIRKVTP